MIYWSLFYENWMIDRNFGVNNEHPFWQGSLECKRGARIGEQKGREDRGKSKGG